MAKAKKQHWVPRFYLKEFSIPETRHSKHPKVWVFSKHEGDPTIVGVKDVAAKRYLYSPKNSDGERSWATEDKLASLESILSAFYPHIAHDFVDLEATWVRKGLSLFISTLMLRHPKNIEQYNSFQEQLIEFYASIPKDEYGRPNISHVETPKGTLEFDASGWHQYKNPTDYDQRKFFVDQIHREAVFAAELLMKKRWSVVFSEEPCFITTDHPVVTFNQEKEHFGLATRGTFLSFPLSPTRILLLDDRFEEPGSQYYPLGPQGAGPMNIIHWTHAHNFMITHRHPDDVNQEMVTCADANNE